MTTDADNERAEKSATALRRGWTTGACATAATRAAFTALITGEFPDPVHIVLPKGHTPSFALALEELTLDGARAGIIKDAGDDPDVTHGAMVVVTVSRADAGTGVVFEAGEGVGVVTKPGLPIAAGEAAINPVPRQLMTQTITELAHEHGHSSDVNIQISIPGGAALAEQTWNPRLGIVGGLSILGTTGVVIPYSCSAWIHSIHRGIDVAIATGTSHVAGCTGSTSEKTVQALYGLSIGAMLDMGDFAGGMLKYLRKHPVARLTIGGGFGKLSKLAMGHLDLHSGRSQVNVDFLAEQLQLVGAPQSLVAQAKQAISANAVLEIAAAYRTQLANQVAKAACEVACARLRNDMSVDVVVIDRAGNIVGRSDG
jgi:cobalt-precorrin-5B (C1)-methyltransferase